MAERRFSIYHNYSTANSAKQFKRNKHIKKNCFKYNCANVFKRFLGVGNFITKIVGMQIDFRCKIISVRSTFVSFSLNFQSVFYFQNQKPKYFPSDPMWFGKSYSLLF